MIFLRHWHLGWMLRICRLGYWERAVSTYLALLGHHCSCRGPPGCWQLCHPSITLLEATRARQILSSSLQARCRHQTGLQATTHLAIVMTHTPEDLTAGPEKVIRPVGTYFDSACTYTHYIHMLRPCTLLWRPTCSRSALVAPHMSCATATHQLTHDTSCHPTCFAHALQYSHPLHQMGSSPPPVASPACAQPPWHPTHMQLATTLPQANATVATLSATHPGGYSTCCAHHLGSWTAQQAWHHLCSIVVTHQGATHLPPGHTPLPLRLLLFCQLLCNAPQTGILPPLVDLAAPSRILQQPPQL